MLSRLAGWLVLIPLCLVLILFALANRHVISINLDPISQGEPIIAPLDVPLYLLVYAVLLLGVVLGGVSSWLSQGRTRAERRTLKREAQELRREVESRRAMTHNDITHRDMTMGSNQDAD